MVGDDINTDDGKIAGYGLVVKKTVRAKLCLSNPTQKKTLSMKFLFAGTRLFSTTSLCEINSY